MKQFTPFSVKLYTDIVFGLDTEKQVGKKVKEYGGSKVMLVYGGGSIKRSGLYDTVIESLKAEGIAYCELGGVMPNPRKSLVLKGIELAKAEGVDFYLGLGGGSAIDSAKGIAIAMAYEGDDWWDLYCGKGPVTKMAPVGTIHTISATGSEMSGSSVILDDIGSHKKHAVMNPDIVRPVFAIMNPALTYTVSPYQTAVGSIDIFSHTFERFFIKSSCNLADEFCLGLMRNVIKYSKIAYKDPTNYEARAELMLAGTFSHNELTAIGRSGRSFTCHGLEVNISAKYDTAHGAGLAMLMPAWMEFMIEKGSPENLARVAQLAVHVFDVQPDMEDLKAVATEGVRRFREWNSFLGAPNNMAELGIPTDDLMDIVANCRATPDGIMAGYIDIDKKDVEWIFRRLI